MHRIIPIFIPEVACPTHCIYCNQRVISGHSKVPKREEIERIVDSHLATIPSHATKEIAFFGGTFTALPLQKQQQMLEYVAPYVDNGSVSAVRLSTRPDFISDEIVSMLVSHNVKTVELGVQTLDDEILNKVNRGYNSCVVDKAVEVLNRHQMDFGMQMMIGLPGDTLDKSLATAKKIIAYGASNTRIYPTLVVKHTVLYDHYLKGLYKPLSVEEAVNWTKKILLLFEKHKVTVLRVGLHPTQGFIDGTDYVAGPFHVSFKQLVQSSLWKDIFDEHLMRNASLKPESKIYIRVPKDMLNVAVGHRSENKMMLLSKFKKVSISVDESLNDYHFEVECKD